MNMRKISMAAVAVAFALVSGAAAVAQPLSVAASGAKRVTLSDRVGKNQFNWSSDAPMEKIKGTAEGVTGNINIDPKNPSTIRGTISARVSTMKSGNATRDGHIVSSNWLDAARYPNITFTISSVSGLSASGNKLTGKATGNFTMHGVTKQLTVPFTLTYIDASSKTAARAPGDLVMVTASFNIRLADFKVAGTQGMVGSKVGETIAITANLFGSTGL